MRGENYESNMAFLCLMTLMAFPLSAIGVVALFAFGPTLIAYGAVMWTLAITLFLVPAGVIQWFIIGPWLARYYDRSVGVRLSER